MSRHAVGPYLFSDGSLETPVAALLMAELVIRGLFIGAEVTDIHHIISLA